MKCVIALIILTALKESHPLNLEILKYDQFMKGFEATGRQMKQETKDKEIGEVVKREISQSTKEDEEEWIKLYGSQKNESGKWPFALKLSDDYDRLKTFCARVHEKWTQQKPASVDARVKSYLVTFSHIDTQRIWTDMIIYTPEKRDIGATHIVANRYIVKGNRPDCFFCLADNEFHLRKISHIVFGDKVCDVNMEGFEHYLTQAS